MLRVKVKNSVCGYLVENPDLPYYLCDISFEPRYRWYLGRRPGSPEGTELAIPVREHGRVTAVVNFETSRRTAFSQMHVDAASRGVEFLGPWITALRERLAIGLQTEEALTKVLEGYAEAFGRMMNHNAGNAVNALVANLDLMKGRIGHTWEGMEALLEASRRSAVRFGTLLRDFVENMRAASLVGDFSARDLVSAAVALVRDLHARQLSEQAIALQTKDGPDFKVVCSKIFKHHFYNVLTNAVQAVSERLMARPAPPGKIEIAICEKTLAEDDWQDAELNRYCEIRVRDNGRGLQPILLDQLRTAEEPFSTRLATRGHGYALFSLRQYLRGIGGLVNYDSVEDQYFEASILLRVR